MDKALMLNQIQNHLDFDKDKDFAKFLGITRQSLSNWKARQTFDAELLYTKCEFINAEWLLTGKGDMLKSDVTKISVAQEPKVIYENANEIAIMKDKIIKLQDQVIELQRELREEKEKHKSPAVSYTGMVPQQLKTTK